MAGVCEVAMTELVEAEQTLLSEIKHLIVSARQRAAAVVNSEITLLYWQIGHRVRGETLKGGRAEYGEKVVESLAKALSIEFGRGFGVKNLRHMLQFVEAFPCFEIVSTLSRQLAWSHFLEIIYVKNPLARDFYAEMCRVERWSVRTLRQKTNSMLFERTALSKKPDELIRAELDALRQQDVVTPALLLKDPYILDFLELNDRYLEKDLEDAILREIEHFLLELGVGFSFVARQKRLQIDNDDFYIDLLFYNRKLKRLVAIELKLGNFHHEYKSQMELYLRWLEKHEMEPGEAPPLGIILCAGKKQEQIELLELDKGGIHVAEYLAVLPAREILQVKLHQSIAAAKAKLQIEDIES
jgi:predicted nuclease of restriction endonuclease-like (RecB) superfamily